MIARSQDGRPLTHFSFCAITDYLYKLMNWIPLTNYIISGLQAESLQDEQSERNCKHLNLGSKYRSVHCDFVSFRLIFKPKIDLAQKIYKKVLRLKKEFLF